MESAAQGTFAVGDKVEVKTQDYFEDCQRTVRQTAAEQFNERAGETATFI